MEDSIQKSYFTIGEVSDMLNVAPSLIRFWEKEFDVLKPEKTEKGTRKFSQKDIQNLRLIHHLVKEKGYTLQGANEKLKHDPNLEDNAQLIDSLKRVRAFLVELKNSMESES
jgi:DNA-binding transcriptional MerR regulator